MPADRPFRLPVGQELDSAAVAARTHATGRRRRAMRVLRIVLPTAAALLVAGAILWPQLFPTGSRIGAELAVVEAEQGDAKGMTNAIYSGIDAQGRPFTLTAARVHSDASAAHLLRLQQPDARIEMQDGRTLTIAGREGVYDRKQEALELEGDVTLHYGDDMTTRTRRARIDIQAGTASGDDPVSGRSSFGSIDGIGFRITQQGDIITVGGPAHMTIDSKAEPRLP